MTTSRDSRILLVIATLVAVVSTATVASAQAAPVNTSRPDSVTASPPLPPGTHMEFEVDKAARQIISARTLASPRYPKDMVKQGLDGQVLSQFVVDETGRVIVETFRVVESTHEAFTESVRRVLPDMRFEPAELGGRRVKQLVQYPATFRAPVVEGIP